jgi:hypothetical protein
MTKQAEHSSRGRSVMIDDEAEPGGTEEQGLYGGENTEMMQ